MDKEREKWISRAEAYERKSGIKMVTILHGGQYGNWPVEVFEKSSIANDAEIVDRTDREIEPKEDAPTMTVAEYAKSVFERMG